jgi:histidinol-phosphate aminotransferase
MSSISIAAESGSAGLDLVRASYRDISLYAPDRSPCAVDLSDNTNLFGVPPAALAYLHASAESTISRYPTLYAGGLKTALAAYCGVDASEIVTGCGSDDVLDSAIRAVARPGDLVAIPEPSFAMIPLFARMNGLEPIAVPLLPNYDIDAEALLATEARIIYLCSPNNPTGTPATDAAVGRILEEARGLVILDEAYAEFAGRSYPVDLRRHARVLVVRTMSKAFGLAGLRVGYAIGAAPLVAEVEKSRGPYKVSSVAEYAATAALTEDAAWVRTHVAETVRNRERFATELRLLGLAPLPSVANFLLARIPSAERIAAAMRRDGVAVRPMPGLPLVGDALRISIGPWPMMERALTALRDALACT